jgi:hypothetical protein
VQLFGLNYWGIIDPTDLEWYTAILDECKSLEINDFLYNVSPYVVNRTLPPQRAASSNVSDSSRPVVVPRRCLIETDIFGSRETAQERSSAPRQDTPNLDTFLGEGSREFNQFGTMRGEMRRDPDVFAVEVGNPVSSSRGYQSHYPMGSGACRGGQFRSKKNSRLQPFPKQGETSDRPTAGAPLTEHSRRSTAMKLEVVLKVASPEDHPLLLGPAIHLRINLVEPHLSLPFIIQRMMTMQVMSSPRRLCPTPLRWRWIIS